MPNIDRSKNLPLIGIDIISISRIQKIAQKYGDHFLERFLSKDEIALTHHRPQSIAGFWAAKEACAKAIGTGIGRELGFLDILITKDSYARPLLTLQPNKLTYFNLHHFSLSITHDCGFAIAAVIAQ